MSWLFLQKALWAVLEALSIAAFVALWVWAHYAQVRSREAQKDHKADIQLSALPNFALNPNLPDIQTLFDGKK